MNDLPSLQDLATRFRDGQTTVRAVVELAIANHQAGGLGAYKTWNGADAAKTAAHVDGLIAAGYDAGPLMGMPCSVKDLYGVPGLPVFAGTDAAFDPDWQRAGPVMAGLLDQLGVVMGKTHTVEMAFGGLGTNPHWGPPRNPWGDGGRVPGGSSSGAGVSLLEGSAVLAFGTDTAGSVRIPASVTGNVGLKITHGRWSLDGIVPLSPSFDTPGILCRTVEDIRYAFNALDPLRPAIAGVAELSGLGIGVLEGIAAEGVDDDIAAAITGTLGTLETRGARLRPATLSRSDAAIALLRKGGLAAPELAGFMQEFLPERIARLDPTVRARIDGAKDLSAADYIRRKFTFADMAARTAASDFAGHDILACATVAISPPELSALTTPDGYAAANLAVLRNPAIVNLLGLCAITLPVGLDRNGMPIGMMLIAPPMQEERLITAALAIERAIGTGAALLGRPPLTA
ncbi:amidase [Paracoccus pacificus]|uniref:Amidase n=1 Tax=Paracoccus pacificus TaxID=1463598 RepID=A0ABW4R3D1_9RHOB